MMGIEEAIFANRQVIFARLEDFGFRRQSDEYHYHQQILGGDFEVIFKIFSDGHYEGSVVDCAFGEVYEALQITSRQGPFVTKVREAYRDVLTAIAAICFEEAIFVSDQANRLATYLKNCFGDIPDYPFKKHPQYASYRVSGKWYALIFPLLLKKLGITDAYSETVVEVVNLKVSPEQRGDLLATGKAYPSYHMSKNHWLSIPLDNRLSDEVVMGLLAESRRLVAGK